MKDAAGQRLLSSLRISVLVGRRNYRIRDFTLGLGFPRVIGRRDQKQKIRTLWLSSTGEGGPTAIKASRLSPETPTQGGRARTCLKYLPSLGRVCIIRLLTQSSRFSQGPCQSVTMASYCPGLPIRNPVRGVQGGGPRCLVLARISPCRPLAVTGPCEDKTARHAPLAISFGSKFANLSGPADLDCFGDCFR
ncbi:uncharacterized protein B0I36DRAFT_39800 [Microdochium trichocladiopsis]|uniref:Uncharacterized protein n=1 Tax=Microdochium trichocladiopsis TaxID=1682393 RepID=A0A9P8XUA0_9PEZI|nr:uncharacterized protein B0I36DRAFT_39800 [Microdochium trichocladiopsis]KAH7018485.1 hypothetical protein B0I36DRAFT_39800 [Microdochium trichocladiopsis]